MNQITEVCLDMTYQSLVLMSVSALQPVSKNPRLGVDFFFSLSLVDILNLMFIVLIGVYVNLSNF